MPSGKRARQQRQAASQAPPPVRSKGGAGARQASPKVLAAAGGVIVLIVIAVVLAVVLGKSSGGTTTNGLGDTETLHLEAGTPAVGNSRTSTMPNATEVATLFKGIPQNHFLLGSPNAPVTLTEFIDLQCPDCQEFETTELPTLVNKYVRTGKLKIRMEPWSILDRTSDVTDSDRGQKATIAAAAQNKAFQFAEVLYWNQGAEESHWMIDGVISRIAASVDGLKTAQLINDANSSATAALVRQVDANATALSKKFPPTATSGFNGTPGIFLSKGNGPPVLFDDVAGVPDLTSLEHAIDALEK
jgi:protein-disulfide isomerase